MPNEQEWRDVHDRLFRDFGSNWEEVGYMDERGIDFTAPGTRAEDEDFDSTRNMARWDRANPDTCRHNVVVRAAGYPVDGLSLWGCISCEKLVPSDIADQRNYEFDVDYNVYVHKPIRTTRNKQVIEELGRVFPDGYELYTRKER